MTWKPGTVMRTEINRLAAQVAANLHGSPTDDEILRLCVGMALSQDLSDEELRMLVSEVDKYSQAEPRRARALP